MTSGRVILETDDNVSGEVICQVERPGPKRMRVAKLLRVSTTHHEQADSPENQVSAIADAISRTNGTAEEWVDTGLTYGCELTGAIIVDRPEVQIMLADARAGRFDALVLKTIARLGRDVLGLLMVKRQLDDLGIELIAIADGYRSFRDPELIFLVYAERAQAGREVISRDVRVGKLAMARRGIWPTHLPWWLMREGRRVVQNPRLAPLARLIGDMILQGHGMPSIVDHLTNQLGLPSPDWHKTRDQIARLEAQLAEVGGDDPHLQRQLGRLRKKYPTPPKWSCAILRQTLINPALRGELVYGVRQIVKRREDESADSGRIRRTRNPLALSVRGLMVVNRDPSEWVTVHVPDAAIFTPEEHEEILARMAARRKVPKRTWKSKWLLTGMLRCGRCGRAFVGNGTRHGDKTYEYYLCQGQVHQRVCDQVAVPVKWAHEVVLPAFVSAIAAAPKLLAEDESHHLQQAELVQDHRHKLELQLADLKDQRRYYRHEHRLGHVTRQEMDEELRRVTNEERQIQEALSRLLAPSQVRAQASARRETVARLVDELSTLHNWRQIVADNHAWMMGTGPEPEIRPQHLKDLLRLGIERIIITNYHPDPELADVEIHLTFANPALVLSPR